MNTQRTLYGNAILEGEDLVDSDIDYLVELAYYKTNIIHEDTTLYGIEVEKTEHIEDGIRKESKKLDFFTRNETIVDKVLNLLKQYKVTPIGLQESVFEIVKSEALE